MTPESTPESVERTSAQAAPTNTLAPPDGLPPPKHTPWEIIQMVFAIATPLLLGVGGLWFSARQADLAEQQERLATRVAEFQATNSTVDALSKYFDMLTGDDSIRAKMGAYAIYMLKREDPEMVVSLVLASRRDDLSDVLQDLASRDTLLRRTLILVASGAGSDTTVNAAAPQSEIAVRADSILTAVAREGWSYVGVLRGNRWTHGPMLDVTGPPVVGKRYRVQGRVYLRDAPAEAETNRLGSVIGVITRGEVVVVQEVRAGKTPAHQWVHVTVPAASGKAAAARPPP